MNKLVLMASFISFQLMASEPGVIQFGRVVDLSGSGFISYNGKTREIKKGDTIEVGAAIVIEHHGQVSFTDNADHRFHLGNSSSASVSAKGLELRGGDLWFQSLNKTDEYKITTVNAMVNYQGGEGILSYDSEKGKTQLMVINGMMKLANFRTPELNLSVSEGHFSFIDNAYEEGAPRDPTPVGEKTYSQLVALFTGISPMDKNSAAIFKDHHKGEHAEVPANHSTGRAIASVDEHKNEHKEEKQVTIDPKIMEDYKNSLLKKSIIKKTVKTKNKKMVNEKMAIHVYGQTSKPAITAISEPTAVVTKSRAPASILEEAVPSDTVETKETTKATPYSKDYKNQNKESDKLIEDLKKL